MSDNLRNVELQIRSHLDLLSIWNDQFRINPNIRQYRYSFFRFLHKSNHSINRMQIVIHLSPLQMPKSVSYARKWSCFDARLLFLFGAAEATATSVVETEEERPGELLNFAWVAAAADGAVVVVVTLRGVEALVGVAVRVLVQSLWKDLLYLNIILAIHADAFLIIDYVIMILSIKSTRPCLNLLFKIESWISIVKRIILFISAVFTDAVKLLRHSTSWQLFIHVTSTFSFISWTF